MIKKKVHYYVIHFYPVTHMWATKCPKTIGLRCDCFVQYCVFCGVLLACLALVIMGSCKFIGHCFILLWQFNINKL